MLLRNLQNVWLIYPVLAFFGASFGSFAGVVISRWPKGQSIVRPGSRCDTCEKPIKAWQNIPIFSWLFLRGRCHYCQSFIGFRPIILELILALAALGLYAKFGLTMAFLEKFIFLFTLLCLAYIDLDSFYLPQIWLLFLILSGLIFSFYYYRYPESWVPLNNYVFLANIFGEQSIYFSLKDRLWGGGLALFGFLGINYLFTFILRKTGRLLPNQWAMGFGDPILLSGIGLFVGASRLLLVVFAASLMGSIVGIALRAFNKDLSQNEPDIAQGAIPFGPFLALAGIGVALF